MRWDTAVRVVYCANFFFRGRGGLKKSSKGVSRASPNARSPPTNRTPLPQEDALLAAYVASHTLPDDTVDWSTAQVGSRGAKQCREVRVGRAPAKDAARAPRAWRFAPLTPPRPPTPSSRPPPAALAAGDGPRPR